jgi:hypothetical protein
MGLVCNNVLHDRTGFDDDPSRPRLLYRARYLDRIAKPADSDNTLKPADIYNKIASSPYKISANSY